MIWTLITLCVSIVLLALFFKGFEWIIDNSPEGRATSPLSGDKHWKFLKVVIYLILATVYVVQGASYFTSVEEPTSRMITSVPASMNPSGDAFVPTNELSLQEKAALAREESLQDQESAQEHFNTLPNPE